MSNGFTCGEVMFRTKRSKDDVAFMGDVRAYMLRRFVNGFDLFGLEAFVRGHGAVTPDDCYLLTFGADGKEDA